MDRAGQQIVCGAPTTLQGYGIDERDEAMTLKTKARFPITFR